MAEQDQMERLQRLRAMRNTPGVRLDMQTGPYSPDDALQYASAIAAPPRRGHGGALVALLFLCVVAAVGIGAIAYAMHSFHSAAGGPKRTVRFVVQPGESVGRLADALQSDGLVSSSMLFQLYYRINGGSENIHAGVHMLDTTMSMDTIATDLQQQPPAPAPTPLTVRQGATLAAGFPVHFLPGKRAEEIGQLLQNLGVVSEKAFMQEVDHGKFNYWFLKSSPAGASVDGFLYPGAPIVVTKHDSAHRIVNLMLREFNQALTPSLHYAGGRTAPQHVPDRDHGLDYPA